MCCSERLDSGKMRLDTEMPVSQHAADQDPTKLNLRAGQTIPRRDAIKGLVTRSANDAAVVIAEGDRRRRRRLRPDDDAQGALARHVQDASDRNANGLPNDEQVTTARDQATLGRAIQERFPRYYRYFATSTFNWRGQSIRNHNHLLGSVEGVDGIKTGWPPALSGLNLVTSVMRRGIPSSDRRGAGAYAAAAARAMPSCATCSLLPRIFLRRAPPPIPLPR
ncbi:D-alanyl-D-alanine carboxypeptidase family protein [Streptomyces sp. L7]